MQVTSSEQLANPVPAKLANPPILGFAYCLGWLIYVYPLVFLYPGGLASCFPVPPGNDILKLVKDRRDIF